MRHWCVTQNEKTELSEMRRKADQEKRDEEEAERTMGSIEAEARRCACVLWWGVGRQELCAMLPVLLHRSTCTCA